MGLTDKLTPKTWAAIEWVNNLRQDLMKSKPSSPHPPFLTSGLETWTWKDKRVEAQDIFFFHGPYKIYKHFISVNAHNILVWCMKD